MNTENIVEQLNSALKHKCDGKLSMKFGKYNKILKQQSVSTYSVSSAIATSQKPQYLLCLKYENQCISSIEFKINSINQTVEISSKTNTEFEGRRYNLLLRAAAMLIAKHIIIPTRTHTMSTRSMRKKSMRSSKQMIKPKYIQALVSRAINPVSTYLLVKYFNATNKEFDSYLKNNNISKPNLTMNDVQTFENERWDNISDEDIENNSDFGEPLLLVVKFTDNETMKRIKQVFEDTLERIGCP